MESITEATNMALGASERGNKALAVSDRWRGFLTKSKVPEEKQPLLARLCENQLNWIENLTEETHIASIGSFEKFVFPMIRAVYPNLVASDLVSVQPMESPTSLVFYRDTRFGSNKGAIRAGDTVFSSRDGYQSDAGFQYSSEVIENEQVGVGSPAVSDVIDYTFNLAYRPVRPGSVVISYTDAGSTDRTLTDDSAGNLIGAAGQLDGAGTNPNTINYGTGVALVSFVINVGEPEDASPITATYDYNSEGNDDIPQIDIVLTSAPVVARPRKLRARWSIEAAAQLKAVHGDEAEVELMTDMANEVRIEIDREIIADLLSLANANDGNSGIGNPPGTGPIPKIVFDTTPPTGISLYLHRQSFIYSIIAGSNSIFQATRRHPGTWILCGTEIANIIQGQEGEQFVPSSYDYQGSGVQFIGTLKGQWRVYLDPYLNANLGIMGYKGPSFLDAGFCYCPWIPFYATPTVYLDDFIGRKGLFTSYAKKPINGLFYVLLELQAI